MRKEISLKILPSEASDDSVIRNYIAQSTALRVSAVTGFTILKQSIDARGKQPYINLLLDVFLDEPYQPRRISSFDFDQLKSTAKNVVVVGAGPAGLFAALRLIEMGIRPIILERGKDVKARRRDLARLNKEGEVNPESNYCFGEGGAGT